jgi:hypothetical protein
MSKGIGTLYGLLTLSLAAVISSVTNLENIRSLIVLFTVLTQPLGTGLTLLIALSPWIISGLAIGIGSRKPVNGVYAGVLAGTLAGLLLNSFLFIYSGPYLQSLSELERNVILTRNLVNGFIVGVFTGLVGGIGGLIGSKIIRKKLTLVGQVSSIESVCKQCGSRYKSTPQFCSVCGAKLNIPRSSETNQK